MTPCSRSAYARDFTAALAEREGEIRKMPAEQQRRYAAVANPQDIDAIHHKEGIVKGQGRTCPHATTARAAARKAEGFAHGTSASTQGEPSMSPKKPIQPVNDPRTMDGKFDYEAFYKAELDKKHKDKSYRYVPVLLTSCSASLLTSRGVVQLLQQY